MKNTLKYLFLRLCYNVHFEDYGLFAKPEKGEKSYQYHFTPKKVNLAIILLIISPPYPCWCYSLHYHLIFFGYTGRDKARIQPKAMELLLPGGAKRRKTKQEKSI